MLILRLVLFLLLLVLPAALTSAGEIETTMPPPLLGPPKMNAYGPGLNSDATGRPFRYETDDGQALEGWNRVKPDAYGPGVGMDEFGRPVRAEPWP